MNGRRGFSRNTINGFLSNEDGIETVEWIAIAAVMLVLLFGVLTVMTPGHLKRL